jgi:hypothetical protein
MKIPALLAALALACGAAVAGPDHAGSVSGPSVSQSSSNSASGSGNGVVDKTKRALHRMGDATRNTLHRIGNAGRHSGPNGSDSHASDRGSDTRAMGASGSDSNDSARRSRMDDAYQRWSSKHNK